MSGNLPWQEIKDANEASRDENGALRSVLLIGPYPTWGWSDIYHGWRESDAHCWARWPHNFPPTHFIPAGPPETAPSLSTAPSETSHE